MDGHFVPNITFGSIVVQAVRRSINKLDPARPVELVKYVPHLCDVILVMTVNPGFGEQGFLPEALRKISCLRNLCDQRGLDPVIEVGGGVNSNSARATFEAGANVIVAGSAIFGAPECAASRKAWRRRANDPTR
jgi:ribulose-phosphate 3-epimerase